MPYVRRQPHATREFAWPPTREELDLIEVVEADSLRPVHARCDEPEPPRPSAPELLKAVQPVRPAIAPIVEPPLPAPVPLPAPAAPSPRLSWRETLTAGRLWLAANFDRSWLIATGGVAAIALSAYLSLRAAPLVSASDTDSAIASAPARPVTHLTGTPFARLELGMPLPMISQPPPPQRPTSSTRPRTPESTATRFTERASTRPAPSARVPAPTPASARLDARTEPRTTPASAQPQLTPVSTLNTRRSPFLSTVIASMPTSNIKFVPASASRLDQPARDRAVATNRASNPSPSSGASSPGTSSPVASTAAAKTDAAAAKPAATAATEPSTALRAARERVTAPAALTTATTSSAPAAQQLIYAALHEYERAYEQLDAKAVQAVWPSADKRALERAFHDLKSQTLVFDRCDIDVARVQATAACRGRATYETRAGQQTARSEPREWTFTLQKSDEAWRIVSASTR